MKASEAALHLAAVLRNVSLGRDVHSRAPWPTANLGLLYTELGTKSREVHLNLVKKPLSAKLVSAAPLVLQGSVFGAIQGERVALHEVGGVGYCWLQAPSIPMERMLSPCRDL